MVDRALPDADLNLRDAADFIFESQLGRKALECSDFPHFPIFLRDLLTTIYRLAQSCHLAEFTDHGLLHLCSLVDRISRWTCVPYQGKSIRLIDALDHSRSEAAVLLLSTLFHDMGMLSQRPEDLEPSQQLRLEKAQSDIPTWVRETHIPRLRGLLNRLFQESDKPSDILTNSIFQRAVSIAIAHGSWPWKEDFIALRGRDMGLAAVLAVSDLLDEDSNRCDVRTLLDHRLGTTLNMAHWIRHGLTNGRVLVEKGIVHILLVRPPGTDAQFEPAFSALRNHFRLVMLYEQHLSLLGAGFLKLDFQPNLGCPEEDALILSDWDQISEFQSQRALLYHLLKSFFAIALCDSRRETEDTISKTTGLNMEPIDLDFYYRYQGEVESRSIYEQSFYALLGE